MTYETRHDADDFRQYETVRNFEIHLDAFRICRSKHSAKFLTYMRRHFIGIFFFLSWKLLWSL